MKHRRWSGRHVGVETILKADRGGVEGGLRMRAAGQLLLRCFVETSFLAQACDGADRAVEAPAQGAYEDPLFTPCPAAASPMARCIARMLLPAVSPSRGFSGYTGRCG